MARPSLAILWTDPALHDLESIAWWIDRDKPRAATKLVRKVFALVKRLARFPGSGRLVPEVERGTHREVIVPPCRIIYRMDGERILIVHVMRSEQLLDPDRLR